MRTEFNEPEKKILDAMVATVIAWKDIGFPYDAGIKLREIIHYFRDHLDPEGIELFMGMIGAKPKVEDSSGNVFADIVLPAPETRFLKAGIARQISKLIDDQGLSQKKAAYKLGISQPKLSALLRGRLKEFSSDQLTHFVKLLSKAKRKTRKT